MKYSLKCKFVAELK